MKLSMIFAMTSLVASERPFQKLNEKHSHEKMKENLLFHSSNGIRGQEETPTVPDVSTDPTIAPTPSPTNAPTYSMLPSASPTMTMSPSITPSGSPSDSPYPSTSPTMTMSPSITPSGSPSDSPSTTMIPTDTPSESHVPSLSSIPSYSPSAGPSGSPTISPIPSASPTVTMIPSYKPSISTEPTKSPTSSPTQECTLIAKLGHPYDTPNDAPYHGYHYDWLEVSKYKYDDDNDDDEYYYYIDDQFQFDDAYYEEYYDNTYCDAWTSAPWCEYKNSVVGQTGAYIQNVDDNYYDMDLLYKETITTVNMSGTSYFSVYHWFNEQDYYTYYDHWAGDHMMAAKLTIWNKTKKVMLNPKGGWSHPVDINIPSHVDGEINPEYQGFFYIEVKCSASCDCTVSDRILFDHEQISE